MNLLLLAPEIFAADGGIARILRLYLKALCETAPAGSEVHLLALNDTDEQLCNARTYAGPVLKTAEGCGGSKTRFVRTAMTRAWHTDFAICGHIGQLPVAWSASLLCRNFNYALVAHGLEVWRPFTRLEHLSLERAQAVWCVSEHTRHELLRHAHLPVERTHVLPNGLDPALFSTSSPIPAGPTRPADSREPTLLTVARLCWADRYKGVDLLLQALPQIRAVVPKTRLRIVGTGDDRARLETLANSLQLADAVTFVGAVNDEQLRQEFSACDVFVLPSTREGFGLVFLEAMAQGKPCVGADAGATPEVLTPDTGVLAPPENAATLATTCVAALERRWSPAAIRARAETFSYAHFRDRLKALLPG